MRVVFSFRQRTSAVLCMRDRAFNWRLAFWHSVVLFPKFSELTISVPNNVTEFSELILLLSIRSSQESFDFPSLLIIIDWNLLGFITILFKRNKPMVFLKCFWRSVIKWSTLSENTAIVLSSAKFRSCASFIKMLKSNGPRMDPCGTPESRIWNMLWTLLMLTDCFWWFRYEKEK